MTNKYIAIVGLMVVVLGFGLVGFVKSSVNPGKYIIENWTGNLIDADSNVVAGEGELGAIEFNTGKTTFGELGEGVLQERVVKVSYAEMASIAWDPITLVPNPGDSKVIQVEKIIGFRQFASESFFFKQTSATSDTGLEVKWAGCCSTASGLGGAFALGASFSKGFVDGGNLNTRASPSFFIWEPSGIITVEGTDTVGPASRSFVPGYMASQSAVVLTASAAFSSYSNNEYEARTNFFFRVIYRILTLPQN